MHQPLFQRFHNLLKARNETDLLVFLKDHPEVLKMDDERGTSGLMTLAYHQLPAVLETLLPTLVNVNLHEAAATGQLHRVISLLAAQPDLLNRPAADGFAPLHLACYFGHTSVAAYLVKKGARVRQPAANPTGLHPLHAAVARNAVDLCQLLLNHGADVDATQMRGVTALHSAAHRGHLPLVRLLVNHGAAINTRSEDGKSAVDYAREVQATEVVNFLKSNGR